MVVNCAVWDLYRHPDSITSFVRAYISSRSKFKEIGTKIKLTLEWLLNYLLAYLLSPWSRVLLEKLTGSQLVEKFLAFYETRNFITAFKSSRHLSLLWARSIQSIPPHPTSWRSILLLSSYLCLGLPYDVFPSDFLTKTLYTTLLSPYILHSPSISFFSV